MEMHSTQGLRFVSVVEGKLYRSLWGTRFSLSKRNILLNALFSIQSSSYYVLFRSVCWSVWSKILGMGPVKSTQSGQDVTGPELSSMNKLFQMAEVIFLSLRISMWFFFLFPLYSCFIVGCSLHELVES